MDIGLSWNLALLFFLFGLSLEAAAALLVLGAVRLPQAHRLGQSAALLIFLGIALQAISLFVPPETVVESYWFILGAAPLLLPAILLRLVPTPSWETAPAAPPRAAVSMPTAAPEEGSKAKAEERTVRPPTEFQRFLEEIPAVLAEHPEGLTLVEIGRELNVEWRKLTGAARELLDRGLVRKEEKRYFLAKGP
jgi:hypothetical protein